MLDLKLRTKAKGREILSFKIIPCIDYFHVTETKTPGGKNIKQGSELHIDS